MGANSQEEGKLFSFEPLHNLADILRAVARAEQQCVLGFDDNEIANPDRGDEFLGTPQEIAARIERHEASGGYVFSGFARQQFVDSGPGADVAPAYFSGQNKNAWRGGTARRRFENRVVHGNVFKLGIGVRERARVSRGSYFARQTHQRIMSFRQKLLEIAQERRNAPEEHSRVPIVASGRNVFSRAFERGFFRESMHRENGNAVGVERFSARAFDVAKAGLWPRRRNAQHDERSARVRYMKRGSNNFEVGRGLRDVVIGGKHGHERVVLFAHTAMQQVRGGKTDRRRGVSADRLGQDVRCGDARELPPYSGSLLGISDDPLARRRKEWCEARRSLLEHRVAANDVEQLFRRARAAARPEARTAASCKDDGMRGQRFAAPFASQGCTTRDHAVSSTRSSASLRTKS